MQLRNAEFKARCSDLESARALLEQLQPVFQGTDYQRDTYFQVPEGRLKLREGNIEYALIHYQRSETAGTKASEIELFRFTPDQALYNILCKALPILVVVNKQRDIYFHGQVKIHLDRVDGLGTFLEVEVIDATGEIPMEELDRQCQWYARYFGINDSDFVAASYSDLLLNSGDQAPSVRTA